MEDGRHRCEDHNDLVHPSGQSVSDALRKREETSIQAISALQKASTIVFKYCMNEDFRQTAMRVLEVNDWTHVPDAAKSCWTQVAKKFHNVDIGTQNDVATVPVTPNVANPLVSSEDLGLPQVIETEKDDFDQLAAFAELMESEP